MEVISVYATYEIIDERGSQKSLVGIFTNEKTAQIASKGRGWYGGNGRVIRRTAILLPNERCLLIDQETSDLKGTRLNVDFLDEYEELRNAALAKLTDEEKRILGVDL